MPHIIVFEEIADYWLVSPDGKSDYSLGRCETEETLVQAVKKVLDYHGLEENWDGWATTRNMTIRKLKTCCDANRLFRRPRVTSRR